LNGPAARLTGAAASRYAVRRSVLAGIALTGVGPSNIRAEAAEQALAGRALDDEAIAEAARLAAEAAQPRTDVRGTEQYKRNTVRVFTARGLRNAAEAIA